MDSWVFILTVVIGDNLSIRWSPLITKIGGWTIIFIMIWSGYRWLWGVWSYIPMTRFWLILVIIQTLPLPVRIVVRFLVLAVTITLFRAVQAARIWIQLEGEIVKTIIIYCISPSCLGTIVILLWTIRFISKGKVHILWVYL